MLTGHASSCPVFLRQRQREPQTTCQGPFENKQLALAAARSSGRPFRWCKSCQEVRDISKFSDLNSQLDQARSDYRTALEAMSEAAQKRQANADRFIAASDDLEHLLEAYILFLRKNRHLHVPRP
jgi:outer membrane murein-binding lipoprotein Lpp